MTPGKRAQFELCDGGDEGGSVFYLFPDPFNFYFYNSFCDNLGGGMPIPVNIGIAVQHTDFNDLNGNQLSEENNHELMDVIEDLVEGDIHEKCMHASGNIVVWVRPQNLEVPTF